MPFATMWPTRTDSVRPGLSRATPGNLTRWRSSTVGSSRTGRMKSSFRPAFSSSPNDGYSKRPSSFPSSRSSTAPRPTIDLSSAFGFSGDRRLRWYQLGDAGGTRSSPHHSDGSAGTICTEAQNKTACPALGLREAIDAIRDRFVAKPKATVINPPVVWHEFGAWGLYPPASQPRRSVAGDQIIRPIRGGHLLFVAPALRFGWRP